MRGDDELIDGAVGGCRNEQPVDRDENELRRQPAHMPALQDEEPQRQRGEIAGGEIEQRDQPDLVAEKRRRLEEQQPFLGAAVSLATFADNIVVGFTVSVAFEEQQHLFCAF